MYIYARSVHKNNATMACPVGSFTKEVNPRLAKRPLKTNVRLTYRGLTYLGHCGPFY